MGSLKIPLYEFSCPECGHRFGAFAKVALRDLPQHCACGCVAKRIISAPAISPDIAPYESPATGKMISSRAQRDDDLRRSGHILYEKGMKEQIARRRADRQREADEKLGEAIQQTAADLAASNRI